jgi:hypothetical protein
MGADKSARARPEAAYRLSLWTDHPILTATVTCDANARFDLRQRRD